MFSCARTRDPISANVELSADIGRFGFPFYWILHLVSMDFSSQGDRCSNLLSYALAVLQANSAEEKCSLTREAEERWNVRTRAKGSSHIAHLTSACCV